MNSTFKDAIERRRSIYAIGKREVVKSERVAEIVKHAATHVPSPFNSQSARALVLFGEESSAFWGMVRSALKPLVPPAEFPKTEAKIASFDSGYGTVLFFEDQETVESLRSRFALYADKFPIWSLESNGMFQYAVWTALEDEGLGASLQHYDPLVDEAVRARWGVPSSWKLLAQMPFGSVEAPAGEKDFMPIAERVWVRS